MAVTPYTETSTDGLTGTTYQSGWTINGTNKNYTLDNTPDDGSVLGFVNGFFQATTVSGAVVAFATAPETYDDVTITYTVTSAVSVSSGAVTAETIIENALRRINVLGAGQSISTADLTLGLSELNDIIDQWRTKSHYVVYYSHDEYEWSASQQSYTIGQDSADFTADRPIKIIHANLIRVDDDPDSRVKLAVYNMDEYSQIQCPAQTEDDPVAIYYKPTYPNGTIYPWPYPDSDALTNKLELFTWAQLSSFATSASSVDLAPGYKDALTWTLAERLTIPFGVETSRELKEQARLSRSCIANVNIIPRYIETADYGIPMSEEY